MQPADDRPIAAVLPELLAALRQSNCVVVKAPTGAGKTTVIPPTLLASGAGASGLILMLEPRRIAAQSAARWMATARAEPVGKTIGYHIRFDRRASQDTRILVVTEGVLLRMLLDDPLLEHVAVILFDEFHERSLSSDLALALARRIQIQFRPELKLVVMSATMDPGTIAKYLDCPVVVSEGRSHPVEIRYLRYPSQLPMHVEAAAAAASQFPQSDGDLLVFLPGVREIRRTRIELEQRLAGQDCDLLELYGDLPLEQQVSVLQPQQRRKVILATNVAETSVTIPGVTAVIDTGYARSLRFYPSVGLNRLELSRISRASADQRAGRAGRTQPGTCLRLWAAEEWRMFREFDEPEIARLELAGAILQLFAWGERDVAAFPWFQAPPPAALETACALLERLGAIDARGITDLGTKLARLPLHPRLARLLCEGIRHDCVETAALAAALLSERDPFQDSAGKHAPRRHTSSDLLDRIQILEDYRQSRARDTELGQLNAGAAEHILRVRDQLLREVPAGEQKSRGSHTNQESAEERFLKILVSAYPDRVARRRDPDSPSGVLVGGRGIRLAPSSRVGASSLIVCIDIEETGDKEALVRLASIVDSKWLNPRLLQTAVELEFDTARQRVVAFQRTRYHDLLLDEAATDPPNSAAVAQRLAAEASAAGQLERALPVDDPPVAQFLARVQCLREWMPELQLPGIGTADLVALLPQLCQGCRSFADLRRAPLLDYLAALLTPAQRNALERESPMWITAASGSRIRLLYSPGRPPVMAVRIQEMFGQCQTPRIAGGRVRVLLHLLAPNMRTQQITDDLAGFWERTYPIVRNELRRRYPKHAWPENPATATAERRPSRR